MWPQKRYVFSSLPRRRDYRSAAVAVASLLASTARPRSLKRTLRPASCQPVYSTRFAASQDAALHTHPDAHHVCRSFSPQVRLSANRLG